MYKKYLVMTSILLLSILLSGCFILNLNDEIIVYNSENEILNEVRENSVVEKIGIIIFNSKKDDKTKDIDIKSFDYKIQLKGNVNETYLFKINEDGTGTLLNEYDETVTYSLDELETHNLYVLMLNIKIQLDSK